MGIKGLSTTFKKSVHHNAHKNPGIYHTDIQTISERHYASNPESPLLVAVDFMEVSHHWLSVDDNQFIYNFCKFMSILFSNGVIPIFCFDGKPPQEKKVVIEARKSKRSDYASYLESLHIIRNNLLMCKNNSNTEMDTSDKCITQNHDDSSSNNYDTDLRKLDREIAKTKCRTRTVTHQHCILIQSLLTNMNLEYIYIPDVEGGEMICAHLQRMGKVKYCMTNDMDVFPMGASWVIREFNFRTGKCHLYNRCTIMNNLGITNSRQFIDMCILHGCDFLDRPSGFTNDDILDSILKFNTIENIIDALNDSNNFSTKFDDDYDPSIAREFFLTPILDDVKYWKPPYFKWCQQFMILKSSNDVKRNLVSTLAENYSHLGCYNTTCHILDMLDSQPQSFTF